MRALIVSDVHGNLEALEAVLAAAHGLWDEVWNLGDMVGYGASPNEVIDRLRSLASVHVRGNHDRVCCGLSSPDTFNPVARAAALWTRAALTAENLAWLEAMPQGPVSAAQGAACCAHGSPLDEDEYLLTLRDAWAPLEQMSAPVTFFGHTHVQGGFLHQGQQWQEIKPSFEAQQNGRKRAKETAEMQTACVTLPQGSHVLINPGSVGQPRDQNWRAAYAIFSSEDHTVSFFRVPYDLARCQQRILGAKLPERLAARLREGR